MTLLIKSLFVALLVMTLISLFKALFAMIRGDTTQQMSRLLGRRLIFSAGVILLLLIMLGLGVITPNPRPF